MPTNKLDLLTIFNNLKTGIIGTKTDKLDQKIDASLKTINTYSSSVSKNAYIDNIKSLMQKSVGPMGSGSEDFLKDIGTGTQITTLVQSDRVKRYAEYDAITNKISYCQRALKVLTDNIISPDIITKRTIQIIHPEEDKQEGLKGNIDTVISRLKRIKKDIAIEKYIDKIVSSTLKKGDLFIEILHSPKGQNAMTILSEKKEFTKIIKLKEDKKTIKENKVILEIMTVKTENKKGKKNKNFIEQDKFKSKFEDNEEIKGADLKDIFISIHNPKFIIRLETERFKSCLGYLVFPKIELASQPWNLGSSVYNTNEVDAICKKILEQLKDNVKEIKDLTNPRDLKNVILNYLSIIENDEDLKIRYVPPELMTHFRINVDKFDPYGESIYECVVFDCKLLMALKTANTIKRLSSATDKRIISIETGLPRNLKNLIETIREGLKKRKISIDSFGSIDTIPSLIPTFEDIYLPQKDGKKYVEFEKVDWGPDPQNDIDSLKFIRDNIVANLSVPPAFVGLEDSVGNRALLTVESIQFARTIVSYQKELSNPLFELFDKIYTLMYPDGVGECEGVSISFLPPQASTYEHIMEYVEQAGRIIDALKNLGIPEGYLKRKYLPHIDWDNIENAAIDDKISKELSGGGEEGGGAGGF